MCTDTLLVVLYAMDVIVVNNVLHIRHCAPAVGLVILMSQSVELWEFGVRVLLKQSSDLLLSKS